MSIKDRNSFANLRKMTLYNPNLDLVNNNVCTKGRNSVIDLRRMTLYNPNVDLVNDNVYTKVG